MAKLNPWYKTPLVYFHAVTHASLFIMVYNATMIHWMIAAVMYLMFGCWGVAITYHRLVSHKSFTSPQWFKLMGLVLGSLGGVGTSIQWTAIHRAHHRYSDTDLDPHNPAGSVWRFLQMQFFAMLATSSAKYIPDLLRDPVHQKFHKYYWWLHGVYACALALIDPFAVVYAYLVPACVLWHVMAALGTFAHKPVFGNQLTTTKDKSTNLWFLGWFAFGEGWHNNHHAAAADYRFGKRKWEVDLSARVIDLVRLDK